MDFLLELLIASNGWYVHRDTLYFIYVEGAQFTRWRVHLYSSSFFKTISESKLLSTINVKMKI
jgi:hypothetical protein